ncbi:MAG: DUF2852 domain-containing protein [Pseudomonadota bacterium]
MTTATQSTPYPSQAGWLSKSEAWLDSKGKGAWIAVMVLGFVFFWPIGLALLFYMIWSKRMFNGSCGKRRANWSRHAMNSMSTTGNSAFDSYKADTLRRLEQEQHEFEAFLERLREAKDKAEFDQFMDERARAAREEDKSDNGEGKPQDA